MMTSEVKDSFNSDMTPKEMLSMAGTYISVARRYKIGIMPNAADQHAGDGSTSTSSSTRSRVGNSALDLKSIQQHKKLYCCQKRHSCIHKNSTSASKALSRRVRLSDAAVGIVITIRAPTSKPRDFLPLNFNVRGYAVAEPRLAHLGLPFKVNDTPTPSDQVRNDLLRKFNEDYRTIWKG